MAIRNLRNSANIDLVFLKKLRKLLQESEVQKGFLYGNGFSYLSRHLRGGIASDNQAHAEVAKEILGIITENLISQEVQHFFPCEVLLIR